uniref:Uncharacterized protein n=1 Tax=Schizaphis graminum TaxID=13262 RepID=A0A2S2PLT9_SCHGA
MAYNIIQAHRRHRSYYDAHTPCRPRMVMNTITYTIRLPHRRLVIGKYTHTRTHTHVVVGEKRTHTHTIIMLLYYNTDTPPHPPRQNDVWRKLKLISVITREHVELKKHIPVIHHISIPHSYKL